MCIDTSVRSRKVCVRRKWELACLLAGWLAVVTLAAGCSKSDSKSDSSQGNQAAQQPAAPAAEQAQPAAAPQLRIGRKNINMVGAAENPQAAATPAAKKPSRKSLTEWTMEELKTAIANKDPQYVPAVQMQGAKSRGDAKKGAELSQLLAAVAKMPGDASVPVATNARMGRNKNKKEDDDPPAAVAQPGAAKPPAAGAPATAPGLPLLPNGGKLRIGRGSSERDGG